MSVVVAHREQMKVAPPGARSWIDLGEDPAVLRALAHGPLEELDRVSIAEARQAAASELRLPYLDWIAELGVANDGFDWWSSELAAKNVPTHLFQRLCSLRGAEDLVEDGTLLTCSSAAMMAEATVLAGRKGFDVRVQRAPDERRRIRDMAYAAYTALPRRRPDLPPATDADTLLVTWVDERSFDDRGAYRDPFFGELPTMLAERGHRVAFLARVLPTARIGSTARKLSASGVSAFLPETLLRATDRRAAWRRARAFDPAIPGDARVGPIPATRLARELVAHNRTAHAYAMTYEPLIARLAATGLRPSRIIVLWEGHAWETALFAAARRHMPEAELIAYNNLNFSTYSVSLYPGRAELGCRPLPDHFVTHGPASARMLASGGVPPEMIRVGCALRHPSLGDRAAGDRTGDVLAAGSISAPETIELIEAAHAAFGDALVAKLHPASDMRRIKREVRTPVRYEERPISELLTHAKALVYSGSIVPFEALAAAVPPILFRSESLLSLDRLEQTPDVRWTASSSDELRAALADAEDTATTAAWSERAREVVTDALRPPTKECLKAFIGDATT